VDTEMIREVRPDIDTDELIAPEEIARVVAELVAMRGNAVIDEVTVRRREKAAWD
jgi:NADP-dependent 3-hydroxy acid dehydrogenase YdfG